MAWRGRVDETQEERQKHVVGNAMLFSICVMAVAVQAYWAWQLASQGSVGDSSFCLLVALWGSLLGGIVHNRARLRPAPEGDVMANNRKTPGTDAKRRNDRLGLWIAIGAGAGLTFGVIFGQIAFGIALGAGVAIVFGSVLASRGDGRHGSPGL